MLTATALAQYNNTAAHAQTSGDLPASKTQKAKSAAATSAVAAPLHTAETAGETVSLSASARALLQGANSAPPPALTYSAPTKTKTQSSAGSNTQRTTGINLDPAHSKLADKLASAGIATEPPVDFKVDANTQHIQVIGNRPDVARIEQLINSDPELKKALSRSSNAATAATTATPTPAANRIDQRYASLSTPSASRASLASA